MIKAKGWTKAMVSLFSIFESLTCSLRNELLNKVNLSEINIKPILLFTDRNNRYLSMNPRKMSVQTIGNIHGFQMAVFFVNPNLQSINLLNDGPYFLHTLLMASSHEKYFVLIHFRWTYLNSRSSLSSMYCLVVTLTQDHALLLSWIMHLFIFLRYRCSQS